MPVYAVLSLSLLFIKAVNNTFKAVRNGTNSSVTLKMYDFMDDGDNDLEEKIEQNLSSKKELLETEANDSLTAIRDFIATDAPLVESILEVATTNPLTMPDYLAQQNELLQIQIQSTKNLTSQSKFQNDLLAKSIQAQIVSNANTKMIAETLASSLPALVMQMQQVAKIPATLKIKSDIGATQHEEIMALARENKALKVSSDAQHVSAINELKFSLSTTQQNTANATSTVAFHTKESSVQTKFLADSHSERVQVAKDSMASRVSASAASLAVKESSLVQSASIANSSLQVARNLDAVAKVARHQTTKAIITRLDGSVYAELTPLELSTHKDISISEAKIKEKEIGDFKTTVGEITNLDGAVIASIKPMEMENIRNAVDAKNLTDEMEFEIPDDILDDVFQVVPLPTFTGYDYQKEEDFIFNGGSLDG